MQRGPFSSGYDWPRWNRASREQLVRIRSFIEGLAKEAGIPDAAGFARQWHIVMKGSIVAAGEGDARAALRARELGRLLLLHEGVATSGAATRPVQRARDSRGAKPSKRAESTRPTKLVKPGKPGKPDKPALIVKSARHASRTKVG